MNKRIFSREFMLGVLWRDRDDAKVIENTIEGHS